ncbi:MAG TPA: RHS repeat-associated core domain-containing protein [Terracidiphilus sp.]|nr:RHS repeat-associated core domain-containing protein [Terracidiphilus sp.]
MTQSRLWISALMFTACASAFSQVQTGTPQFGTFSAGPDVINIGNLNLHLSIPVLSKAGRAGLNFNSALSYDSSIWYPVSISGQMAWQPVFGWGWQGMYQPSYITYKMTTASGSCGQHGQYSWQSWTFTNLTYFEQSGVSHAFPNFTGSYINSPGSSVGCPPAGGNPPPNTPASTFDSSGLTAFTTLAAGNLTAYVTNKAGTTFFPVSYANGGPSGTSGSYSAIDSNGNEITGSNGVYTDTTGNTAFTVAGSSPNPVTLTFKTTSGGPSTVTVNFSPVNIKTNFACSSPSVTEYTATGQYLVSSIVLQDTSSYSFTYEATPGNSGYYTGRVASITLPAGNTIKYTYQGSNNGISCADGSTLGFTRQLNADSGSAASTWSYLRSSVGSGTSHTEVVDGLANYIEYDFVEPSNAPTSPSAQYYETSRKIYEGAATGTPLLARSTCYNGASAPCTTSAFSLLISQLDTYDTHDGIQMDGATSKYDSYGNVTDSYVYDYGGSTSRGSLLRHEQWTYSYSVPGLPTLDAVYDGSGTLSGKTAYAYDQTTPTASSGVPQHVAPPSVRGNLTTATYFASSTISYIQTFTYEDTGSRLTSKDSSTGATTTFQYDPTFVYNKEVDYPTPASGVVISQKASFETSYTGLLQSTTDPNSQASQITSYDGMLRPTQATFPDGGKWIWSYSPTTSTQEIYQTSTVYSTVESELDGYGRNSRSFLSNGQSTNPWYQQDVCLDGNGNPSYVSHRYQGSGTGSTKQCSGSFGDAYNYDVLGRITKIARADGNKIFTYNGRASEITDENGVKRITQVDGLGRPTVICEISSSNLLPSDTPSSCGTDITGTGYLTTYSYALATGTTTVTQGAQTRTFKTDWMGRETSVTEPESGTTSFAYTFNSTGWVMTRTKPKANQASPSITTTTTTQYDLLGRVLSVTYTDGTPTKSFAYDASAGTAWSDLAQTNLKGQISLASISGSTGTAYSYDPMGRVSYMDECLPSGCGTVAYNRQLHYTYDLAGDMLSSTDGTPTQSTYTVSQAGELQSLTSSLNNSTNPPNIISNVQNGPNGPGLFSLGNGLTVVSTYNALGHRSGGFVCNGSSQASCAGGTQLYGFTTSWSGVQFSSECDTVLNVCVNYGYDDFNRLNSRTVYAGTAQNFSYVYDRYGNRWQQNVTAGSGPQPQLSFNTSTNRISTNGYAYDAAGNLTNDGLHTYTYDAEGNITAVDGGGTAQYVYNALNQRVRTVVGSTATEFVFNANGQRVSVWNGSTRTALRGQYYWGSAPVAYYLAGGAVQFQHQDWLGTERLRTTYNGGAQGTFTSLSFGDGFTATGTDGDPSHFGTLDHDYETVTDHAQFRQYSNAQGRWMMPDPYAGSYDASNPQSMNRYAYVLNNPLAAADPLGLLTVCFYGGTRWYHETDKYGNPIGDPFETDYDPAVCSEYGNGGGVGVGGGGTGSAPNQTNAPNDPNYYAVVCRNLGLNLAKTGCTYACVGASGVDTEPIPIRFGGLYFTGKQIWEACKPQGQMFCPTGLIAEGTTNSLGETSNAKITSCFAALP